MLALGGGSRAGGGGGAIVTDEDRSARDLISSDQLKPSPTRMISYFFKANPVAGDEQATPFQDNNKLV